MVASPAVFAAQEKPALLGGKPVRSKPFPSWPVFDATEEKGLMEVLRSGKWGRGSGQQVNTFEAAYAKFTGARGCVTTVNGTNALYISLNALGVGPGDEVSCRPHLRRHRERGAAQHALPVFVDTDSTASRSTRARSRPPITDRTRPSFRSIWAAMRPTWTASWPWRASTTCRWSKTPARPTWPNGAAATWGGWGTAGCFSFQACKNLNSGEGGAIISDDENFIERCYAFPQHRAGRGRLRRVQLQHERQRICA